MELQGFIEGLSTLDLYFLMAQIIIIGKLE